MLPWCEQSGGNIKRNRVGVQGNSLKPKFISKNIPGKKEGSINEKDERYSTAKRQTIHFENGQKIFHQIGHAGGQLAHEEPLVVTNHQGRAKQNHRAAAQMAPAKW